MEKKSYKIISFLLALIIPLLVTGPFLPDLILSLTSIWFILYTIKYKKIYIYNNIYFFIFLAFCILAIISSLLSENILLSFESSLFYFRIGIFALMVSYLIDVNKNILNYFYYFFLITFYILIFDGFIQYYYGYNLIGYPIQGVRVSSFFGDELIMGSYLSRLFPLFFGLFILKRNKSFFEVSTFYLLLTLTYLMIFMSGERASFFFINLVLFFTVLFMREQRIIRLSLLIIGICSVVYLVFDDSKYYKRFILEPINSFGLKKESTKKYIFSPQHDDLYKTAWNMFLDKPIIGHGPKLFRIKCKEKKYNEGLQNACDTHPHNFYIQLLSETGVLGFAFLFGSFLFLVFKIIQNFCRILLKKEILFNDYQICLLSGLLITLWPIIPNGNFFNNYLMILYSLQIGFYKAYKANIQN